MKMLNFYKKILEYTWTFGFVRGGMDCIMSGHESPLDVDWVKMPHDRMFADPFILDVLDDEIILLCEDYAYMAGKGVISLLHINRATWEITSRKVVLELPTHVSFPAIMRKDGHIYIYPESALSGKLDVYEYDSVSETMIFVATICNEVVWDSYITEYFGKPYMFTASDNDYKLDIYQWDEKRERYVPYQNIQSAKPNSRLGGAIFEYCGAIYYPAQDNSKTYGGAIDIKRIDYKNGKFSAVPVKHLTSPHPQYQCGMHTLNEYKGVVVIDVKGYKYRHLGLFLSKIITGIKKILSRNE